MFDITTNAIYLSIISAIQNDNNLWLKCWSNFERKIVEGMENFRVHEI